MHCGIDGYWERERESEGEDETSLHDPFQAVSGGLQPDWLAPFAYTRPSLKFNKKGKAGGKKEGRESQRGRAREGCCVHLEAEVRGRCWPAGGR